MERRGPGGILSSMTPVSVSARPGGLWQVVLPDDRVEVCDTLHEAWRVGSAAANRFGPRELIVFDVYHRVVVHELVEGVREAGRPAAGHVA